MKKNRLLVAVIFFAAVCTTTLVSCKKDKNAEPKNPSTEQNGGNQNEDQTSDPVTYTLTALSNDEEMGTVTGGGTYEEGTEATLTATPASEACVFENWSDGSTENPRTLTVTENMELTATFGYAFVDLGLPSGVKWAACNVGATTPEGYGGYFAWGETETKGDYTWDTYKWCNGSSSTMTKYCVNSKFGTVDNKTTLEPEDDAAHVNWGGAWRMPTDAECQELIDNCTWTWTSDYNGTGVAGRIVTSNINGKSIFLPAAGQWNNSYTLNTEIYYWNSSLSGTYQSKYHYNTIYGKESEFYMGSYLRYAGQTIRGVCE